MTPALARRGSVVPRLSVTGLEKSFGGVHAVRSVDLAVSPGETLGLIGPNGSGKTTIVNCVSGVIRSKAGVLCLDGVDITRWRRRRRAAAGLIRTYQNVRLFRGLTVAENVEAGMVGRNHPSAAERRRRTLHVLEEHGLEQLARKPVSDLAYGQQRRVEIARALVSEPRALLLDEPAAGLGEEETSEMRELLILAQSRLGFCVIVIDHDVSLVMSMSNRVAVLQEGRLIFTGSPTEAALDATVVSAYLGSGLIS